MPELKPDRPLLASLAILAATCLVTQMLVAREFLDVHTGSEIVLGLYLAVWLLLTAAGSWLGGIFAAHHTGRDLTGLLTVLQGIAGLLPALLVGAVRFLAALSLRGVTAGFGTALGTAVLVLAPFCLVTGFLIPVYVASLGSVSDPSKNPGLLAGRVYGVDCLGSLAGGALFSFALITWCTPFQTAALLFGANWLAAVLLNRRKLLRLAMLGALAAATAGLFLAKDWERLTAERLFAGAELIWQKHTRYGQLAATRSGTETTIWLSNLPAATSGNPLAAEEAVHFALAQCSQPRRVLLLSGGVAGAIREALKHGPEQIDLVEVDPELLALVRDTDPAASDPRVTLMADDARRFVRSCQGKYDAIIMDAPAPYSLQANRNFTIEFFRLIRERLAPGGVFSFRLPGAENLIASANGLVLATAARSLRAVFPETAAVPGESVIFLAGSSPLRLNDVPQTLKAKDVSTLSITPQWLAGRLTDERIRDLQRTLSLEVEPNRDFFPRGYYAALRYWLERFGSGFGPPRLLAIGLALALILALAAGSHRVPSLALAASGFSGLGLEVVLLAGFQIVQGSLYQELSFIVTAFLGGAAAGSWAGLCTRGSPSSSLLRLEILLTVASFLTAPALIGLHELAPSAGRDWLLPLAFALLNGIAGFLVGAEFQPAVAWLVSRTPGRGGEAAAVGRLYALDVLGACLGAVSVAVFLLPAAGLTGTCYLLGSVKLLTSLAVALERRKLARASISKVPGAPLPSPFVRRPALSFFALLSILGAAAMAIVWDKTASTMLGISLSTGYHGAALALLGVAFLQALGVLPDSLLFSRKMMERWHRATGLAGWRWLKFLGLGLIVFYPLFRCFFKVPYLFCHVCPRKCVFGWFRPYLIPAALVMNLNNRHWCEHSCPVGTLLHCQETGFRPPSRRRWTRPVTAILSGSALLFTVLSYFLIQRDHAGLEDVPEGWYQFFFKNSFSVSLAVLAAAGALVAAGFARRRAFCHCLCPIGTASEAYLQFETWTKNIPSKKPDRKAIPAAEESDAAS